MSPVIENLLAYLWKAFTATAMQLFIVLGVGVIFGFIIHHLSRAVQRYAGDILPICAYAYLFMIPGTIVHELAHLVVAVLFLFKIGAVVLFQCKPNSPYGGYIERSKPGNPIQEIGAFFIGIAPIVLGALAIYGFSLLLIGPGLFAGVSLTVAIGDSPNLLLLLVQVIESVVLTTWRVFANLVSLQGVPGWQVWLFLYLAYSLSNSMNLSDLDWNHALKGFLYLFVLLLLVNVVLMLDGKDVIGSYVVVVSQKISGVYAAMLFALSLNLLAAIIAVPLGIMFGRHASR